MMAALRQFWRWINVEKGIFFGVLLWLAVIGVRFHGSPVAADWGPPRVLDSPPAHYPVGLHSPPPVGEFLAGARASPFTEEQRREVARRRGLPTWLPPREPAARPARPAPKNIPPPPKIARPSVRPKIEDIVAAKPKPYELPVRLAGRVKVGHKRGRTIFVAKEDGRPFAVKEGEEIPGFGVRVVLATKNVVIVENEKGKRFRLEDLLRAKAAEDAGEEAGGGEGE